MQFIATITFFVSICVVMIIPSFSSSSIITTTTSSHPQNFTCNSTKDCSAFFSKNNKNKNNLYNYVCTEAGRCSCLLGFEAQKISEDDKQETSNFSFKCSPIPCDQCYTVNMTCLGAIECRCLAGKVTQQGTVCELQYSKEDHHHLKPRKKLRKRVRIGGQQGGHRKKSSSSFAIDLNRKTLFTLMAVGVIAVGMLIVAVVCFMGFKENAPYIWPEKYGKGKGGSGGDKVKEGASKKKKEKKKVVVKNDGKLKNEKSKVGAKSSVQAVSAAGSKSNFSAAQPTKSFAPQPETKSFSNFSNSKSKQG